MYLFIAVIERLYQVLPKDNRFFNSLVASHRKCFTVAFICFLYTVPLRYNLVGVFGESVGLKFSHYHTFK